MAYPVCVDASILTKWVTPEADSAEALNLFDHFIETGATLVEPVLALYEVPSAILRKVAKNQLTAKEANEALAKFHFVALQINVSMEERRRVQRAWNIASQYGLSRIYDCIYLALAEELGADCWTADARFHAILSSDFPRLKLLSSIRAGR